MARPEFPNLKGNSSRDSGLSARKSIPQPAPDAFPQLGHRLVEGEVAASSTMAPISLERNEPPFCGFQSTDTWTDNKRKATDQPDGASPTKRIKDSLSNTVTPEADGKPRVVPFPEKVCFTSITPMDLTTDYMNSQRWPKNAMVKSNSGWSTMTIPERV